MLVLAIRRTTAGVRSASIRPHARISNRRVRVLGSETSDANVKLVGVWRELGVAAELMSAARALSTFDADDIVVARLDVRPTLDGVEPGLFAVLQLERRGARLVNTAAGLLAATTSSALRVFSAQWGSLIRRDSSSDTPRSPLSCNYQPC